MDNMLVDACAMRLIREPSYFDVIVTENTFGDILTDEASMLAGSLGMLPSASLAAIPGRKKARAFGLYEPIHGSAPDIAGKDLANPIATILSVSMLLYYSLGLQKESSAVDRFYMMRCTLFCSKSCANRKIISPSSKQLQRVGRS